MRPENTLMVTVKSSRVQMFLKWSRQTQNKDILTSGWNGVSIFSGNENRAPEGTGALFEEPILKP
ncbi:hypothetical protein OkiPb00461_09620 [Escherichia coli]|nr:hypothetical protein JE86ST05C_48200 [Escherichia coli]